MNKITNVMPTVDLGLILEFNHNEYRYIDIKPVMIGSMFEPLKEYGYFIRVKVDDFTGTIV